MSNQSARQTAYRTAASSSGTFNEDKMLWAVSVDAGFTGTYNERLLQTINSKLGTSYSSLPEAQAAAAADRSKAKWTDLRDDVTSIGAP